MATSDIPHDRTVASAPLSRRDGASGPAGSPPVAPYMPGDAARPRIRQARAVSSATDGPGDQVRLGPGRLDAAIEAARTGGATLVIDDWAEASGAPRVALVASASSFQAADAARFMRLGGGGLLTVVGPDERWQALSLRDGDTVSAKEATSDGHSASDRALTCRVLASTTSAVADVRRRGQVVIGAASDGGLLVREGIEEAALDLLRLADAGDTAVLVFPVDAHGELVDPSNIGAELQDAPVVTLDDLLMARLSSERIIEHVVTTELPTRYGTFQASGYRSRVDGTEHVAFTMGRIDEQPILTRVHQACLAGDAFHADCGCREKLDGALRLIAQAGRGAVVYLTRPARTTGVPHSSRPMDVREIGVGAQMLLDVGVRQMRLITTSDRVFPHLTGFGLSIVGRVSPDEALDQPAEPADQAA